MFLQFDRLYKLCYLLFQAVQDYEADAEAYKMQFHSNYSNARHPKEVSLQMFAAFYDKKWKPSKDEYFAHFSPTYLTPPNCQNTVRYEKWCEMMLLMYKPGSTPDYVKNEIESLSEALEDFVVNSPFCPPDLKLDFKTANRVSRTNRFDSNSDNDESDEEDQETISNEDCSDSEDEFEPFCIDPAADTNFDVQQNQELIRLHQLRAAMAPNSEDIEIADEYIGQITDVVEDYDNPKLLDEFKDTNWSDQFEDFGYTLDSIKVMNLCLL